MRFSSAAIIRTAAIITVAIFATTFLVFFKPDLLGQIGQSDLTNLSNFGQFVSGVFAPIAFVWLAIAVLLQSRELELQREELKLTREEMKQSRQVFELQKEEMKRAADDAREQTAIMSKNLERDAERQVYSEFDLLLYSFALYIAANHHRTRINFNSGGGFYIVDASDIASQLDRNNYDRIFLLFRYALDQANQQLRARGQEYIQAAPGCSEFVDYCYGTLKSLATDNRYLQNRLSFSRLTGLQIHESMAHMGNLKIGLFGGSL